MTDSGLQTAVSTPLPPASAEELWRVPLFEHLHPSQMAWIIERGEQIALAENEYVYHQGETADYFYIVIDGELQVTQNQNGREILLANHRQGGFSGEVPLLSGTDYIATGRATMPTRLMRFDGQSFREMFAVCPMIVSKLFSTLAQRIQNTEALARQHEKMSALGTLSAGLAHELNNPAAAAGRAADDLRATLREIQEKTSVLGRLLNDDQVAALIKLLEEVAAQSRGAMPLDMLEQGDRESEIDDWLSDADLEDGWELAAPLVSGGITIDQLETLRSDLEPEPLGAALRWLVASLNGAALLEQVEQSTRRISELVQAVKSYSHMDQASTQATNAIDIHEGIENTLKMMSYKLRNGHVNVQRDYDRSIAPILVFAAELNQVWTNMIDNAIDAMPDGGTLRLRTWSDGANVWVEIGDSGSGIPLEIQTRIFEPFFTTKDVGKGTGLGLDIAHRVVVNRHRGEIRIESKPGDTRFQVRLPMGTG